MKRIPIAPRDDWQRKVEQWGLLFHTEEAGVYWNESAYYSFTSTEITEIEKATNELHAMCLTAVQHVIDNRRYADLAIPDFVIPAIEATWEQEPPSIYGRFDLAYDGFGPPKLLEYNADTPTSLLEAAVVQWKWLEELYPNADQFNSIWEGLVDLWKEFVRDHHLKGPMVHFAYMDTPEDAMTVAVLRDTAQEAGIPTEALFMGDIGWDSYARYFVDLQDRRMWTVFKLYPWEWLSHEKFARNLLATLDTTQWIEPIWKMILSNKGILAILWELFPSSPYLLPCFLDGPRHLSSYVRKPLLSREGANITLVRPGEELVTDGEYGEEGFVYQDLVKLPDFDGNRPIVGSWVIDAVARGIGIRESDGPVTDNLSRFVPHLSE